MITNLEKKLKFIELVDKMNEIKRAVTLQNGEQESDSEHSYDLAIMVTIFISDFPEINELKAIKIALFHDLVEIFAGDTVIFDEKMTKTKKQREAKAVIELEKVLGKKNFKEIKKLILEYENKSSLEAEFVYELDKLQPMIKIVMEGGKTWKNYKINKDKLMKDKYKKITDKFGFREILKRYEKLADKKGVFYFDK